jgi:hypothetical protein
LERIGTPDLLGPACGTDGKVEALKREDPEGYVKKNATKRLAAIT